MSVLSSFYNKGGISVNSILGKSRIDRALDLAAHYCKNISEKLQNVKKIDKCLTHKQCTALRKSEDLHSR